ncbi:MAG TPA: 50S ribosomal protein L21 [Candidatus Saccharimonadales bacterium]|nr:50S ribosomal protein L21 [Candidatus Saccharimonadales bacterium]
MKKAVINTGGKQYLVSEGDELDVEMINSGKKDAEFDSLLVYENGKINIGDPIVKGSKVTASILDGEVLQHKVTSIRYKAKKRVHKLRGHRQKQARIKIKSIK